ncbi:unnamed protein product [Caenorhabditis brenneri]
MPSGNIVKLDIGGTLFKTSKSTLTKFDGFFKTMLETDIPLEKDEHEAIFVDRDPKHFRLILNYMRDGFVNIPDSKSDVQEIQIEAQYYLLDGLVKLCNTQKPVSEKKNNLFPKSVEEFTYAIVNSTKKAVIQVPYETRGNLQDEIIAILASEIVMKYDANFDIVFFPVEDMRQRNCRICDMSTGNWSRFLYIHMDKFLKEHYGVE